MPTLHHVIGDIKEVLGELNTMLERSPIVHTSWMEQIALWKQEYPIKVSVENRRSKQVLRALNQLLPENAIIVTEVGQHQMWTAQFYCHNPKGRFYLQEDWGRWGMVPELPSVHKLAIWIKGFVNVAGDGSFRMNCNELATIARYNLPIIILLMNNHTLGMVRQWQTFFYEHRYSETTLDTSVDWIKLAQAYGINGMHLGIDDDPAMVLNAAISLHAPYLLIAKYRWTNKVFPMVAPGASIDDMIEDSPEQ